MERETLIVGVSAQVWKDFKRAILHAHPEYSEDDLRQAAAFTMTGALAESAQRIEDAWPYETRPVDGGWNVFYCEDGKAPRLADGHPEPFPPDQKANADRKRKALNRKWHKADKETEEHMARNGGALIV